MHNNHYFGTFLTDPWIIIGAGLSLFFGLTALLGPPLSPFDPWDMSFTPISAPSTVHFLGVNDCGQDIFSELLQSVRNTIFFGFICGISSLVLGVLIGLSAGWFGGTLDLILMRLGDVLLAVPSIMILILAATFFRPAPATLALLLASLTWPTIGKVIRAQTLSIKNSLHIQAARQLGGSNWYIIRRHLLPELYPLYLIGFTAKCRMAIFMEASLAFLGLFDPSRKSLGLMINYALKYYYLDIWWNWLMPPIVCLSLMITGATFLAIGLEKVLDPRLKQFPGDNIA